MIKMRLTFVDDEKGISEFGKIVAEIERSFVIISKSKVYKGLYGSKYSNIYLDLDFKEDYFYEKRY